MDDHAARFASLMQSGEYAEALQFAEEERQQALAQADTIAQAQALVWLSDARRFMDLNEEALAAAVDALGLLPEATDPAALQVRAEALRAQADGLRMLERRPEALASAQEAEALARRIGYLRGQVDALRPQTSLLLNEDRNDEALAAARTAIALAREASYPLGEALALDNLSDILLKLEQREEALQAAVEAEALCLQLGDRLRQANALFSQALALRELDRLEESLAAAVKAEELYSAVSDRLGQGYALRAQAEALHKLSRHEEALSRAEAATEAVQQAGSRSGEGNARRVAADALRGLGRPAEALQRATESAALFEAAKNGQGLAEAQMTLALAALDLGRTEEAEAAARQSQKQFLECGMPGMAQYAGYVAESTRKQTPESPGERAVARLHQEYGAQLGEILSNAEKAEDAWHHELRRPRQPDCPLGEGQLVLLRQWPSYATLSLLPYPDEVAGGYLLRWGGRNLVIDPGLGFLTALRQAGYHLTDIDGVVVTHWHIDHTGDLEEMLTSLFEANDPDLIAQLDFFLAPGAFGVYAGLLAHNPGVRTVSLLRAGENIPWGPILIRGIAAGHRDLTGRDGNTIGLRLELLDEAGSTISSLGLTSDTRWRPDLVAALAGVDLLVLHLGGIYARDLSDSDYAKNHLGVKGTAELLSALASSASPPRAALLSEIGKELEYERVKLCTILGETCGASVFPAELGMQLSLPSLRPSCDGRGCSSPATRWGTDPHDRRRICARCDDCVEPLEAQAFWD
ncbi:MAG: MBL fold metallo-hydrolase [Armatimonadota bacterium]